MKIKKEKTKRRELTLFSGFPMFPVGFHAKAQRFSQRRKEMLNVVCCVLNALRGFDAKDSLREFYERTAQGLLFIEYYLLRIASLYIEKKFRI